MPRHGRLAVALRWLAVKQISSFVDPSRPVKRVLNHVLAPVPRIPKYLRKRPIVGPFVRLGICEGLAVTACHDRVSYSHLATSTFFTSVSASRLVFLAKLAYCRQVVSAMGAVLAIKGFIILFMI